MADITVAAGALAPIKYHDNGDNSYSETTYLVGSSSPGAANWVTSQPAPLITKTTLAVARPTRVRCVILNAGQTNVYVGPDAVTAVNGFLLLPGASITLTSPVLLQGISIGATGLCHVSDEYA